MKKTLATLATLVILWLATLAMLLLVGDTQSEDTPPVVVPASIQYKIQTADCDLLEGYLQVQVTEQKLKDNPDDKMGEAIMVLILKTQAERGCEW